MGDFALEAADDAGECDGAVFVGDHKHVVRKRARDVVERRELFFFVPAPDDDVMPGEAIVVERVEGLAELEHDVVRDIDDVVDRPLAERDQALLHPFWRGADPDPFYGGRQVAAAEIRRFDLDRCTSLDCRTTRFVVERWFAHGLAGQRCNFTGDTEDGQPVGTVRRDRELEGQQAF